MSKTIPGHRNRRPGREGGGGWLQRLRGLLLIGAVQPRGSAESGAAEPRQLSGDRPGEPGGVQLWGTVRVNIQLALR